MDFVCVGAQKAGTSSLDELLRKYSVGVGLPKIKETKFFLSEQFDEYDNGIEFYYQKYFSKKNAINGEIDPEYLYFSECAKNLYDVNPKLKVIIIVRDPISRAISHFDMNLQRGYEKNTFEKAIEIESIRIKQGFYENNNFSYLARGRYKNQIERFVEFFGDENILLIQFEDFVCNQGKYLKSIAEFLNIQLKKNIIELKSNEGKDNKSLLIRDLLFSDNIFRKVASKIVKNKFLKIKIGHFINKINSKPQNSKTCISAGLEKELHLYFKEDIDFLRDFYDIKY